MRQYERGALAVMHGTPEILNDGEFTYIMYVYQVS